MANKPIEIIIAANIENSVAQLEKDIKKLEVELRKEPPIEVVASIKEIRIDKTAANYVKNELKKVFNTVTVDIDGNFLSFGEGTTTMVRKQTDAVQKAVSAAQKKLGNIKIDYGSSMDGMERGRFEAFRKEIDGLAKDLNATVPQVDDLSNRMDVFANSLLASKKATAENAAEIEKFAKACQRADKEALDIEQNYLGKANNEQKTQYQSLISQLTSFRSNPENTTALEIDGITDKLSVLKAGIKSVSAESEKASKEAQNHAAALDKSLNAARTSLDAIKNKNWDTMDDSQKKRYRDLSFEIVKLRGSENLTEQATENLQRRITALGADANKTATSVKAAATAAEKEAKALETAYLAFDKAWADVDRIDKSGLSEDQLKSYRALEDIVKSINQDRGSASSSTIKSYTADIQKNKGDIQGMLASLKKTQAEAKKVEASLSGMKKKLGGFEEQFRFNLNDADLSKLDDFKNRIDALKVAGPGAAEKVELLGNEIEEFMLRIQTGGNRTDFLTSQINEFVTQMNRVKNIGGDTRGIKLSSFKEIELALTDLQLFVNTHTDAMTRDVSSMMVEILADYNNLGKIDITKIRQVLNAVDVSKLTGDEEYASVALRLEKMVTAATQAATAVDDLHHSMSDSSQTQGFKNRINDDIRKLDEFYGKYSKVQNNLTFANEYTQIRAGFNPDATEEEIKKNEDAMNDYIRRAKEAGLTTDTLGDKIRKAYQKFGGWWIVSEVFMRVIQTIKDMVNNVVELDSGLTELRKVTDETSASYEKFMQRTKNTAKEVGATVTDMVSATADWARLGYSLTDAEGLAKVAVMYKNVGDDVDSIDDATSSLISTIQGFKELDISDATNVLDVFNEVSNRFAITSGGIGEAVKRSASAMSAANNTMEETVALATAMNTVVQDPEQVGTSLRSLSMFLRASKTEAEDAGEDVSTMASSVSKLRSEILALTGNKVDIQIDDNTFKSTYQILKELSEVWDDLSDVTQSNILNLIAGKRQSNAAASLIQSFEVAEKALVVANESAGSATRENEKYLDSIQGKLQQLKASFESLSSSVIGSNFIKILVDGATSLVSLLDTITQQIGPLPGVLTGVIMAMKVGGFGIFDYKVDTDGTLFDDGLFRSLIGHTKDYQIAVKKLNEYNSLWTGFTFHGTEDDLERIASSFDDLDPSIAKAIRNHEKLDGKSKDIAKRFKAQGKAMAEAATKAALLNLALNAIIVVAGTLAVKLGTVLYDAFTTSAEEMDDMANKAEQLKDSLQTNTDYINELTKLENQLQDTNLTIEEQNSIHERMLTIQDDIIEKYGLERAAIDIVNDGIRDTIDLLNERNTEEFNDWKREAQTKDLTGESVLSKSLDSYESFSFNTKLGKNVADNLIQNPFYVYDEFLDQLDDKERKLFEDFIQTSEDLYGEGRLYIETDMDADEAESYLDTLTDIVNRLNADGDYDFLYSFLSKASSAAEDIINGSEKSNALYYYDNIVKVTSGVKEYYSTLQAAEEKYQEILTTKDPDQVREQYNALKEYSKEFIQSIRDSSIYGADETASYYERIYADILDTAKSDLTTIELRADTSGLRASVEYALQELSDKGIESTGEIKSYLRDSGNEGEYAFEMIKSVADDLNKTLDDTVDYLKGIGYFGTEYAPEINSEIDEAIQGYQNVINTLTKVREEQDVTGQISTSTMMELTSLGEDYAAMVKTETNALGELIYTFDTDAAEKFALDQLQIATNAIIAADGTEEQIDALNSYYRSMQPLTTQMEGYITTVKDLDEIQKAVAEGTQYTEEELNELLKKYPQLAATLDETTGKYKLTESSIESLKGKFTSLIQTIIDVKTEMARLMAVFTAKEAREGWAGAEQWVKLIQKQINEFGAKTVEELEQKLGVTFADDLRGTVQILIDNTPTVDNYEDVISGDKDAAGTIYTTTDTDKTDPWKDAFDQEYQEQKHLLSMEQIDQKTFLNWLDGAYKKYFSNLSKYQDEYWQYEEEVYSGRQGLIDEYISDLEKEYEHLGDESKVIEGLNKLLAEKNGLMSDDQEDTVSSKILEYQEKAIRKQIEDIEDEIELLEDMPSAAKTGTVAISDSFSNMSEAISENVAEVQRLTDELTSLGNEYNSLINGNVDYNRRPFLTHEDMWANGWTNFPEGDIATTYSAGETIENSVGAYFTLEITPILENGDVLTPEGLRAYIYDTLQGNFETIDELLELDDKNLIIAVKEGLYEDNVDYWEDLYDKLDTVKQKHLDVYLSLQECRAETERLENASNSMTQSDISSESKVISLYKDQIRYLYQIRELYLETYSEGSDQIRAIDAEISDAYKNIVKLREEAWEAQRDAQVDALEEEQDAIEDYQDAIEDILDATVDLIKRETEAEIEALETARDEREEYYEAELDNIEKTAEARKEALEDELEGYRKIIEAKKEALQDEADEEDYNDEVAKRSKEISDLQTRIDTLSLDDSKAAAAERLELEADLETKKEELRKYQRDHSLDKQIEALDDELEAFEDNNDEKVELIEKEQEAQEKRIEAIKEKELQAYDDQIEGLRAYLEKEGVLWEEANRRIQTEGETLWKQLRDYAAEYTRDVESLEQSWEFALTGANKYNDGILNLLDTLDNLKIASANNETSIKNLEDTKYTGEFTAAQKNSIIEIRSQMQVNSKAWNDANAAGDESAKGWWSDQNQKLGAKLNEILGGEYLKYNPWKGTWSFDGVDFYTMPIYHEGGIVGDSGSLAQNELIAVLKKNEMVLTEPMQDTMAKFIDFAKNATIAFSSLLADDPVKNIVSGLRSGGTFTGDTVSTIHIERLFDFHADNVSKDALPDLKNTLKETADYTIRQLEDRLSRRGIKTKAKTTL